MTLPTIRDLHTDIPIQFAGLLVTIRARYISGPVLDAIDHAARLVNLQRLIDERSSNVAALISAGKSAVDADSEVPAVTGAPVLRDDIAVPMLTASIRGFVTDTDPIEQEWSEADSLEVWYGQLADPDLPESPTNRRDPATAWPHAARETLFDAVRRLSTVGADPKDSSPTR